MAAYKTEGRDEERKRETRDFFQMINKIPTDFDHGVGNSQA
jgi:hypothetical protein